MNRIIPKVRDQRLIWAISWVAIALAFATTYWVSCRLSVLAADDSYIHRRIAANLVHSGYAYFNVGERVMATSSPLWTALLAINELLLPGTHLIPLYEALGVGIACTAGLLLVRNSSPSAFIRFWSASIASLSSVSLIWILLLRSSIEQMETPLAVALLLTGIYGLVTRRIWGASILVLAAFTRYEFFAAVLLFVAVASWKRDLQLKAILYASATAVILTGWLFWQYHTVIPNTVKAKEVGYSISRLITIRGLEIRPATVILESVGVLILFLGKKTDLRMPMPAKLLVAFGCLVASLYMYKKTYIFPWYVPVFLVPLCLGLLLWSLCTDQIKVRLGTGVMIFGFIAVSLKGTLQASVAAVEGKPWQDINDVPGLRAGEYKMLGEAIANVCPKGTLMTSELGGLGMGFPGEILDGFGLVSPDAIKYHPMKIPAERSNGELGAIPVPFVVEKSPDVIVTYPQYGEDVLRKGPALGYQKLSYPPLLPRDLLHLHSFYGISNIFVLVKQGGLCSAESIDLAIKREINRRR